SPQIVLSPTDSAGPSLTVWQSRDSLLLLVPWRRDLAARWLQFFVEYRVVDHAGNAYQCGAFLASDTLRFSGARRERALPSPGAKRRPDQRVPSETQAAMTPRASRRG